MNQTSNVDIQETKLTAHSRGAGCGCKIAPHVLQEILHSTEKQSAHAALLVGNHTNDDAAVFDLGNGQALISTTDFFMPIVDDAFDFGRIASANAISDVYAMGGKPLMAIAVLGWPVEKLPASLASKVLDGARNICSEAGIPLAGGHSIDATEPIFGLSVTGIVSIPHLKKNNTAAEGDYLFLTKPLGTGVLSTAQKRGVIGPDHLDGLIKQMTSLNQLGEKLGAIPNVTAMTDVTGFGLLGHVMEMAKGCGCAAEIFYDQLQVLDGTRDYLAQRIVPDATFRNWNSYSQDTAFDKGVNVMEAFQLLPDPQTNGGLLFSVSVNEMENIKKLLNEHNLSNHVAPIGRFIPKDEKWIYVRHHSNASI